MLHYTENFIIGTVAARADAQRCGQVQGLAWKVDLCVQLCLNYVVILVIHNFALCISLDFGPRSLDNERSRNIVDNWRGLDNLLTSTACARRIM